MEIRVETYIDIGEKYHKVFNEFLNTEMNAQSMDNIQNFLNFCSISLPAFEKFEGSCRVALDSLNVYKNTNDILLKSIKGLESNLQKVTNVLNLQIPERETMNNPFEILLTWVKGEILDTKAMIEAMQKLLSLPERKAEYVKKLDKKRKDLENLKQGKSDLKSIFSSKSKDDQKQSGKKTVEFYEFEVSGIDTIQKTAVGKLMNYDLPEYKNNKIINLSKAVQLFAELMQSELGKIKFQSAFIRVN